MANFLLSTLRKFHRYVGKTLYAPSTGQRLFSSLVGGYGGYTSYPNTWTQDRIEMVAHYKHWTYIAISSICQAIAGLRPQVAEVFSPEKGDGLTIKALAWERACVADPGKWTQYLGFLKEHRKYQRARNLEASMTGYRKSPHVWLEGGSRGLREYRKQKSLHQIHIHEEVEPVSSDHPLLRLLLKPNQFDTMGQLFYELVMFLELCGSSYLWCIPNEFTRLPQELWVLPAHWVRPRTGNGRLVEYYEVLPLIVSGGGPTLKIPPEQVINFHYKSPIHKVDGWSPQIAAAEWIDVGESIDRSRFWMMKNGCFPLGTLEVDPTFIDPDDADMDRIYSKFLSRFQGETRFGLPAILPPGTKYTPLTINPQQMAFAESANQLRDWILAMFKVPKEVAGLQDAGSEIAMYGPMAQFCTFCLAPKLVYLAEMLTTQLAQRWSPNLRLWWDDPTPNNPQQRNADLTLQAQNGWITVNEGRAVFGLEPYPHGGDDPMLPSSVQPMPWVTGQAAQPPMGMGNAGGQPGQGGSTGGSQQPSTPGEPSAPKDTSQPAPPQQPPHPANSPLMPGQKAYNPDQPRDNHGRFGSGGRKKPATAGQLGTDLSPLSPEDDYAKNGVRAKAFKDWFGNWESGEGSKVVAEKSGEPEETHSLPEDAPLIVYHGTGSTITEFDKDKQSSVAKYGKGFYFTDNRGVAQKYAENALGSPDVVTAYLNIRNPIYMNGEESYTPLSEQTVTRLHAALAAYVDQEKEKIGKSQFMSWDDEAKKRVLNEKGLAEHIAWLKNGLFNEAKLSEWSLPRDKEHLAGQHTAASLWQRVAQPLGETAANAIFAGAGFDGIRVSLKGWRARDGSPEGDTRHTGWIAFDPNQVKAKDNKGTFSSDSNNIYKAKKKAYAGQLRLPTLGSGLWGGRLNGHVPVLSNGDHLPTHLGADHLPMGSNHVPPKGDPLDKDQGREMGFSPENLKERLDRLFGEDAA